MADNTVLNTGSGGDTIATDDIGGVKHQLVKIEFGAADSATQASSANPFPVVQTGTPGLPSGASTAAKQPALGTAGSASADVLSVQGVASMTPLLVNGSGVTQPVSDAGGSLTVDDGAGSLTVDGTVTANAGTGPWPVTDNGGSLTVDGTVAVSGTVAVTDNSGSLTVDAPVGTPAFVTATPSATGGWSKIKYAAQTTTVVKPKASAGTFGGYYAYNPNASVAYIQVFDLATATTVTLGTTAPDMIFAIPAGSAANLEITNGVNMALGMQLACTTTAGGLTAPGTGLDLTIFFK